MKKRIIIYTAILFGSALFICLLVFATGFFGINKTKYTYESDYRVTENGDIEKSAADVVISESDNKILYINPTTMNITLYDKNTENKIYGFSEKAETEADKSLLIVNYVGEDNTFHEWTSYKQVTENDSFTLKYIENGVRISMEFNEGASERFYEYLPEKMSIEHYEMFVNGLVTASEDGKITESTAKKYKQTLSLVYKKSKKDNCYNCTYVGNPPVSACRQLIEMADIVGYTKEMLLLDAETFGFTVEFEEPAVFDITLDICLDDDALVAVIPADLIASENDYYTITNIEVLPNLGTIDKKDVTEGYLLVPDGSGALMKMNTYNAKVPDYVRAVYNNDWYKDYRYIPEYETELMMPVFGMIYDEGAFSSYGIMGIIESGADYAYIEAMLAASDENSSGRLFNKVYATYDVSQYEWVPVFGEFADNTSTYLSISEQTKENFSVRYMFYGENVSYYNMARDYGDYIFGEECAGIYNTEAKLFLEFYGTVSVTERIAGIPYNSRYSMTEYTEVLGVLKDLQITNCNVSYLGAFDGGKNNMLMRRGKLESENGTRDEFDEMCEYIKNSESTLFLGTDFMRVWDTTGNGFVRKVHADSDYTKNTFTVYGTDTSKGKAVENKLTYMMLKPTYLLDTVKDFLKKTDAKDANYFVASLGSDYYADYGRNYISPTEAQMYVDAALTELANSHKTALMSPRADKFKYGTVLTDIPRNSSEYAVFYCTIPFMQLVLNGRTEYTGVTVNNNSMDYDYYVMQALETGSELKFTLTGKSVDILRDTEYSHLYSVEYGLISDDMKKAIKSYTEAMNEIGTTCITNHMVLTENIFLTEYETHAKLYTNYNGIDETIDGLTIPAYGYVVVK